MPTSRPIAAMFACVLPLLAVGTPTRATEAPRVSPLTAAECEVWARELAFARSVADHDADAFAGFLHEGAVFGASRDGGTRGRDKITAEWAGLIAGEQIALQWYPAQVAIGGEGDIAYSTGPALYAGKGAQAGQDRIGGFHSTWHRGADGVWRVLFDDGIAPRPATAAEVAAFHVGRRESCPGG